MEATREALRLLVRWAVITLILLVTLLLGFRLFLRPLASLYNAARPQPPAIQESSTYSSQQEIIR